MPPVDGPGPSGGRPGDAGLHEPFRPRRGRLTATWVGAGQGVLFTALALLMPSEGPLGFQWPDRFGVLAVSAAIGAMLWRFARLAVLVTDDGARVRNLSGDRVLAWAEIVTVRFGGGQPWATLDLADGDTLAVMAIQRADGPRADAEARRLATLVGLHSRTERDT